MLSLRSHLEPTKPQRGFTLVELVIVIGILAILLAITLAAINPAQHFKASNDTQRRSDVKAILSAVGAYMAQNSGALPASASITTSAKPIASGAGNVDLCASLVTAHIADLPSDPTGGTRAPSLSTNCTSATSYNTGYTIMKSAADNRITIAAPSAQSATISVTR